MLDPKGQAFYFLSLIITFKLGKGLTIPFDLHQLHQPNPRLQLPEKLRI